MAHEALVGLGHLPLQPGSVRLPGHLPGAPPTPAAQDGSAGSAAGRDDPGIGTPGGYGLHLEGWAAADFSGGGVV